ncbi:MAG: glutathione peroxidase [Flavobacteriales bacterium]
MNKKFLKIASAIMFFGAAFSCSNEPQTFKKTKIDSDYSIHQFTKVKTIEDEYFDFSTLKGKKVMIVNTASKCGLTPQYKDLQSLYEKYKSENFEIIGFPSNDFMSQEPGNNKEIVQFCTSNYGVTFPLMSKIKVKKEESQDPVYSYLTNKSLNKVADSKVSWNFQKYLIDENGFIAKIIPPRTNPLDTAITHWIEQK